MVGSIIQTKTSNYQNELNTIWLNNGGVGDDIKVQENQWMVGISKKNKNDKILYDIYVSLSTNQKDKLTIEMTQRLDFNILFDRILESL